jgi:hypothetical protein
MGAVRAWKFRCPRTAVPAAPTGTFKLKETARWSSGEPVEIDAGIELGGSTTTTSPQLFEPFSIDSSGFLAGGSLGAKLPLPLLFPGLAVGVRGTVLGFSGNSGASIFHPTDERFTAGIRSMEAIDGVASVVLTYYRPDLDNASRVQVNAFIGEAWGQTALSSPDASVDKTLSGHSYGVGVQVPLQGVLPGVLPTTPGTLIGFQWRHYKVSGDVLLFGPGSDPVHVDQRGNIFTGTLTVPISGSGSTIPVMSDIRVKRDLVQVGQLDNGIHLYRYRYIWDDQVYVGVMAQEVVEIVPTAVVLGPDGYLRVDYGQLGLCLMTLDEWNASQN